MGNAASTDSDGSADDEPAQRDGQQRHDDELPDDDAEFTEAVSDTMVSLTANRPVQTPVLFELRRPESTTALWLCWTDMASSTPRVAELLTVTRDDAAQILEAYPSIKLPRTHTATTLGTSHIPTTRLHVENALHEGGSVVLIGAAQALHAAALLH